jgi:cytochrome c oxidase subunit 3
MATMVTSTRPVTKKGASGGPKSPGPGGNGSKKNGHGDPFSHGNSPANRYRIGMWVGLASILMLFTSLTSAYIVRAASANDWQALPLPRVLWLSTSFIILSSLTLETSRRKLKAGIRRSYLNWLWVTMALGVAFLVIQLLAWRQLVRQGVYLASNPHGSFFYLLTAAHGVHLAGGLLALIYLVFRGRLREQNSAEQSRSEGAVGAATLYWHFMDALWIYLFLLLFFWR